VFNNGYLNLGKPRGFTLCIRHLNVRVRYPCDINGNFSILSQQVYYGVFTTQKSDMVIHRTDGACYRSVLNDARSTGKESL